MKRAELSQLPDGSARRRFLYAVQRSDGCIKVGCTKSARARIGAHFDAFRRAGTQMVAAYVVETQRHQFAAERELIRAMQPPFACPLNGKREWFTGADPVAVASLVRQIAAGA